nr:NUDIX domain protein [uncultured bacterium]AIA15816.1 NUDIX domain protein [uncultured bacterium]
MKKPSSLYERHSETPAISEITDCYAGVVICTEDGLVIGQQRDDIPGIDNPGMVGTFGGALEAGETPQLAAWRELVEEETNLVRVATDFEPLLTDIAWRKLTGAWVVRHFFTIGITRKELNNLKVYEGQGWAIVSDDNPNVIPSWRPIFSAASERSRFVRT